MITFLINFWSVCDNISHLIIQFETSNIYLYSLLISSTSNCGLWNFKEFDRLWTLTTPNPTSPFILILGCHTSKNSNIRGWQVVVTQSKEKLIEEKKYIWFLTMYVVYVENKCIKHVLLYHLVVPVPARWIITQSLSLF